MSVERRSVFAFQERPIRKIDDQGIIVLVIEQDIVNRPIQNQQRQGYRIDLWWIAIFRQQ